ncbi:MAG: MFS transporter [Acidobacteria bacterium]|nr:MFS transporter [Acidobacteriota bacterium]
MTRALRHRNFRLFLSGQFLSLIGTWVQNLAQAWLVYQLTHSSIMLGVIGFAGQIPYLVLSPVAGVVADRVNRRWLITAMQILSIIQALILAVLTLTNTVKPWHIFCLALGLGIVGVFDMTARQTFLVEMVGKDDLMNAIALNSSVYNSGRVLGPAIAGVLVATIGEGWCFVVNAASFFGVIVGLLMMRVAPSPRPTSSGSVLQHLREGVNYVRGHPPSRALLLLLGISSITNYPFLVLMPIFADEVLHGGPTTLGLLMSSTGCGAIVGALYMASRTRLSGLSRMITGSTIMYSLALILFSFSRNVHLSMLALAITGAGLLLSVASTNTTLQTIVPDELRGRVVGFYGMMFMGMAPIGSLLAGWLAGLIGARSTVALGAIVCIVAAVVFNRHRPIVRAALQQVMVQRDRDVVALPAATPEESVIGR